MTVLAKFDDGKPRGKRLTFTVEGGLHYIKGNSAPYFSLTANGCDNGSKFGGCCHDVILRHFQQLADLAALHLSDIDGVPNHADANGWYYLAGYFGGAGQAYHVGNSNQHFGTEYRRPTQDECLAIWAKHARIPVAEAKEAAEKIAAEVELSRHESRPYGIHRSATATVESRGASLYH